MSNLSEVAHRKLNEIVERGKRETAASLAEIVNEFEIRKDLIVRPNGIHFDHDPKDGLLLRVGDTDVLTTTGHSRAQVLSKVGLREDYYQHMVKHGEVDLMLQTFKHLFPKTSSDGALIRKVGKQAKGVLSPSYRRMDASPIFAAYVEECVRQQYVPFRGSNTDTRYVLSFLLPNVIEIAPDEFCVFGVQIRTSDYGLGSMQFNIFILRVMCVNLATGMDVLRKIHLGKRFDSTDESPVIELSSRTHSLDTRTVASAIRDAVKASGKYFDPIRGAITAANQIEPNIDSVFADLKKKGLKKDILERAKILYETPQPIEVLPQGNTTWRLSNVISLLAQAEQGDSRLMLEDAAFDVITRGHDLKVA